MPIYEFICSSCSEQFEELVRTSGNGLRCPGCDSKDIERKISSFSFRSAGGVSKAASMGKDCGPCAKTSCSGCG